MHNLTYFLVTLTFHFFSWIWTLPPGFQNLHLVLFTIEDPLIPGKSRFNLFYAGNSYNIALSKCQTCTQEILFALVHDEFEMGMGPYARSREWLLMISDVWWWLPDSPNTFLHQKKGGWTMAKSFQAQQPPFAPDLPCDAPDDMAMKVGKRPKCPCIVPDPTFGISCISERPWPSMRSLLRPCYIGRLAISFRSAKCI